MWSLIDFVAITSSSDVVKAKFITKASFAFQYHPYPYVLAKSRKDNRRPPMVCNLFTELDVRDWIASFEKVLMQDIKVLNRSTGCCCRSLIEPNGL